MAKSIKKKVEKIQSEICKLQQELIEIQKLCPHLNKVKINRICYDEFLCKICQKHWME